MGKKFFIFIILHFSKPTYQISFFLYYNALTRPTLGVVPTPPNVRQGQEEGFMALTIYFKVDFLFWPKHQR